MSVSPKYQSIPSKVEDVRFIHTPTSEGDELLTDDDAIFARKPPNLAKRFFGGIHIWRLLSITVFGLLLAMGFSYGRYIKEACKDVYDMSLNMLVNFRGSVIEDVKLVSDSNMLPSKLRYRKELAHNLQKHGVEITDIMLAELDVWEQPVIGLRKGRSDITVSKANTMTAERMLGYGNIEGACLVFRICSKDYIHYLNYPLIVYADDNSIRVGSYLDRTDEWVVDTLHSKEDLLMVQKLFDIGTAETNNDKERQGTPRMLPKMPVVMLCSKDPKLDENPYPEQAQEDPDQ